MPLCRPKTACVYRQHASEWNNAWLRPGQTTTTEALLNCNKPMEIITWVAAKETAARRFQRSTTPVKDGVDGRDHEQGEEGGRQHAADYRQCHRHPQLRAFTETDCHRQQAEDGRGGRHEDRA